MAGFLIPRCSRQAACAVNDGPRPSLTKHLTHSARRCTGLSFTRRHVSHGHRLYEKVRMVWGWHAWHSQD
jgi:hypothetical protein